MDFSDMNKKPIIIVIINNKGGVGKTTTVKNLAQALIIEGKSVGVVDMDDQANLTSSYRDEYKFDLISCDKSIESLQKLQMLQYDYIIIDTAPDLGIDTINSYIVSDYAIIPTHLAGNSIIGTHKTMQAIEKVKEYNQRLELLGVVITSYDRRDNHSDQLLQSMQNRLGTMLFSSMIRVSATIKKSDDQNKLVQDFERQSWTKKSTEDYQSLAREIITKTIK